MTFYPEDALIEIITSLCKDTKTREAVLLALEAYPSIELPEEFGELIDRDVAHWYFKHYGEAGGALNRTPVVLKDSKHLYWWKQENTNE